MDQLDFQDHPYEDTKGSTSRSAPPEHTVEFSDFPPDMTGDEGVGGASENQESKPSPSIFTLSYYQQFFDIDTFDVGNRILSSVMPNPKRNYLEHVIRPKPDLYGPFWICATLTFFIGIAGNVANFFATSGQDFTWRYDFNKVSLAATVIFSYWLIIPVVIWAILRWRGNAAGYTLTELICVYGYSLAIFIPCSILWLIPVTSVQILFAVVCSLLSGVTLLITLYPAVKNDSKQVMVGFLVIVIILHSLLATGFVMYFFKYNAIATTSDSISPNNDRSVTDITNTVPSQDVRDPHQNNGSKKSRGDRSSYATDKNKAGSNVQKVVTSGKEQAPASTGQKIVKSATKLAVDSNVQKSEKLSPKRAPVSNIQKSNISDTEVLPSGT